MKSGELPKSCPTFWRQSQSAKFRQLFVSVIKRFGSFISKQCWRLMLNRVIQKNVPAISLQFKLLRQVQMTSSHADDLLMFPFHQHCSSVSTAQRWGLCHPEGDPSGADVSRWAPGSSERVPGPETPQPPEHHRVLWEFPGRQGPHDSHGVCTR